MVCTMDEVRPSAYYDSSMHTVVSNSCVEILYNKTYFLAPFKFPLFFYPSVHIYAVVWLRK